MLRHRCRGTLVLGCWGGASVVLCPGGRATTAYVYGEGTTTVSCHCTWWLGEAVRTAEVTRGGEHRRRQSTPARGVTVSGAPGADPTMVPRILAWRKHHGKAGANVPRVWAAPRWRSAPETAPRRRTCVLAAQRLCSATEPAPRQRTGVQSAPRRRTRALAAPRWCSATVLVSHGPRGGTAMAYLCVSRATMAHVHAGGTTMALRHWTGVTAGQCHDGALPRRSCHGLFGRRHGGALPRRPRHDGALPRRPRHDGALPRRPRHDGARVRSRRHDGALPLSPRHVGAELSGQAPRWRLAVGGRPRMCICPPQDCMSGPGRGPGRLAGGVGPA